MRNHLAGFRNILLRPIRYRNRAPIFICGSHCIIIGRQTVLLIDVDGNAISIHADKIDAIKTQMDIPMVILCPDIMVSLQNKSVFSLNNSYIIVALLNKRIGCARRIIQG